MANELPPGEYPPDNHYQWEFRYIAYPEELAGYHPTWVSGNILKGGLYRDGALRIGDGEFSALYIDVNYMDHYATGTILNLARQGLPVCMKRKPIQPGRMKKDWSDDNLVKLMSLPNVKTNFIDLNPQRPIVSGENLPEFFCRIDSNHFYFFLAHPKSRELRYPLKYGQSFTNETIRIPIRINIAGGIETTLIFEPYQSILIEVRKDGTLRNHDIGFMPKVPLNQ
jgi:hypothetical protein